MRDPATLAGEKSPSVFAFHIHDSLCCYARNLARPPTSSQQAVLTLSSARPEVFLCNAFQEGSEGIALSRAPRLLRASESWDLLC